MGSYSDKTDKSLTKLYPSILNFSFMSSYEVFERYDVTAPAWDTVSEAVSKFSVYSIPEHAHDAESVGRESSIVQAKLFRV